MIGTCALCEKNAALQDSHLIPQWAYRRVCEAYPTREKAPVLVAADGNAVLINKETTGYLLCAECEQRFGKREDYVAKLTELEDGQIKLFRNVTKLDTPRQVLALLSADVDAEQIVYFGASVMWRGCVMTGGCKLGSYKEKFRLYLLGEAPFPSEAVISMGLFEESPNFNTRGWVSEPASRKVGLIWVHGFLLDGLVFRCLVGKAINQKLHQVSLAGPHTKKYVSILKPEECGDFLAAVEVAGNATPRGKLAKTGR